ncbi:MAG: metallophosphoesterase [Candidatus Hydrogenedentes bacterium]|nr:metallophosphoesterase [Candidatus Hydrogenedentota bacterium]
MWRFVQVSDPHFAALSDGCGNNLMIHALMPEVAICLKNDLKVLDPDFVLVTGDLAAYQSRDAVYAARDLLDALQLPYYPLGGNQDFIMPRSRAWFVEAYHAHLPTGETYYSFTHENLHVCALDPWWEWEDGTLCAHRDGSSRIFRWALPPHQIEWLREDLDTHRDVATIVTLHYPLLPLPARLRRLRMLEPGYLRNGEMLRKVLAEYPQVAAVFSGHAHMHYVVEDGGITHVVTGALAEYPVEYREIEVHEDRLEVTTRGLSDKSFATRSLVLDNTWPSGQPQDRSVTIPLRTTKKPRGR